MSSLGELRPASAKTNVANSFNMYSLDVKNLVADSSSIAGETIGTLTVTGSANINNLTTIGNTSTNNLTTTGNTSLNNAAFTGSGIVDSVSFSFWGDYTVEQKIITSTANGSNAIYTVPSGKKMIPMRSAVYNPTVGSINIAYLITRSAVDYYTTANVAVAASLRSVSTSFTPCLSAGDVWSINGSALGLYLTASYIVFSDSSPIQTYLGKLTTVPLVLFTAPSTPGFQYFGNSSTLPSTLGELTATIANRTGGTLSYTTTLTPNGGSPATIATTSITTTAAAGLAFSMPFNPGDSISFTSSANTAGQDISMTVFTKPV